VTLPPSAEFLDLQSAVAGRYSLEHEIGRGGMGVVFRARDVALERLVAIKLLPRNLAQDATLRERFVREARIAAALMHPNIVPIHAVESNEDCAYIVMALVEGETLAERVARTGVLAPDAATRLMRELAWALGYAHGRGIVHRDIKPDNILIEFASGRAMVADFGIARVASRDTLTTEGSFVGTVQYMSPEQAGAELLDGRSDVYSLGATMYFALTGASPVEAPTLPAMLAKLMTEEPVPLATVRPELPPTLVTAVTRSLAKDRGSRYATADELASALQNASVGHAVRPEVRAFLREITASKALLAGGLGSAGLGGAFEAGGLLPRGTLPFALVLGFGALVLFAVTVLSGLTELRRLAIPWSDVDDAILTDMREILERYGNEDTRWRNTRRILLWLGGLDLGVSGFVLWKASTRLSSLPAIAKLDYAVGGVGGLVGLALVALSLRRTTPPAWLFRRPGRGPGDWTADDLILRALRRIMRWKWAQRLYAKGGPAPSAPPPSALPTATLLLQRVEELVSQLPEAMRARLGDVLPAAAGLERAIGALRDRTAQLDRAMAELRPADPARAEFAVARERSSARLTETVSALERLRTDLLRLGAGLIAADGITAELEKAQQLSAAIDAELQGLDEVPRTRT
jgi:hypothetical protein